jgi:hypothetical protein
MNFEFMTDRIKRAHFSFGGKVLMDKKSAQIFLRSIFNPTHHSLPFCLDFLADRRLLVGKRCGWKLGWSDLSIPCKRLHVRYYNTLTKSIVHANRDQRITKKYSATRIHPSWLIIWTRILVRPFVVTTMAVAAGEERPDGWQGCHPDGRSSLAWQQQGGDHQRGSY